MRIIVDQIVGATSVSCGGFFSTGDLAYISSQEVERIRARQSSVGGRTDDYQL